jgi:HPt (histidine-containing phosphotransfer) domain-containing protein
MTGWDSKYEMIDEEEGQMLSIEAMRGWGANVDEALVRCLNNENFYLMLVQKAVQDQNFDRLPEAVAAGDLDKAFDAAHALKGVTANLALTPILKPVQEITELLRGRTETDYAPLLSEIRSQRESLMQLF